MKLFPGVLRCLKLPEIVIAVTGSNGKTSTAELIVHVLKASGKTVAWNFEGSNQTEGVATLLLRSTSLGGKVLQDAVVMECDERYAKKIFENVQPTVLLITNLCRDQLTRNGHHEFIEDCLRAAVGTAGNDVQLVLNADDPYVSSLALDIKTNVLYFGICSYADKTQSTGVYDDGAFCPVCKARMTYSHRIVGHFGSYNCDYCGLKRNEPDVEASLQEDDALVFGEGLSMQMKQPGITGAYNFCSAVAVAKAVGINISGAVSALDGYELTGGRTVSLSLGERRGQLLISKHENSLAYNNSLYRIVEQKKPCTVVVLVDSISRKYYTSETSWLWDIDFDLLADDCVKNIVLAGRYENELATRFVMSAVPEEKIGHVNDLSGLRRYIYENTTGDIYAVTCFSDKAKILDILS